MARVLGTEENPYKIKFSVDMSELDEALKKAEKLVELLERAHELSIAVLLNSAT